jgi:protein involved in polysaccharide export with SLBB domain
MRRITYDPRAGSGARNSIRVMLLIAAATINSGAVPLQEKPQSQPPGASSSLKSSTPRGERSGAAVLITGEEDYRIGVHDLLEVQVDNMAELTKDFRVTASGTFLMPFVGRVTAKGKTPEEVAEFIADRLRGDYLKDPKVLVRVKEYNSRAFFIQGAVRNPNVYQVEGKPSLLEMITLAGGLADNHGSSAYIIRKIKQAETQTAPQGNDTDATRAANEASADAEGGPRYEMQSVNITGLLKGHFDQDVFLEPGDIINVPPTDVFFVAGEVNAPGSFPLKDGTTLRQAISLAQGTKFNAATGRCIIFRENVNTGKREEMRVDVAAVMSGKKEDIEIMANDIIILPNSRAKSIGGALLKAFGLTTITRVPVY